MKQNISWGVTGLLLIITSAITAAMLPNKKDKGTTGRLQASIGAGWIAQLTCSRDQASGALCTWSITHAGGNCYGARNSSRTSTVGVGKDPTSSITTGVICIQKVKTITSNVSGLGQTSLN
jgi:hypothetical protein